MRKKYLIMKIFLIVMGVFLFSNNVIALPGSVIIENAENYRTFTWTCNSWNARPLNNDGLYDPNNISGTHDPRYPFWPAGEPIGRNPDGSPILATGSYTGVAYGWGLKMRRQLSIKSFQLSIKEERELSIEG